MGVSPNTLPNQGPPKVIGKKPACYAGRVALEQLLTMITSVLVTAVIVKN